jgi:hypothetical protein
VDQTEAAEREAQSPRQRRIRIVAIVVIAALVLAGGGWILIAALLGLFT